MTIYFCSEAARLRFRIHEGGLTCIKHSHRISHGPLSWTLSSNCAGWCCCHILKPKAKELLNKQMTYTEQEWWVKVIYGARCFFFFLSFQSLTQQRQDWSTVGKEATFHLLWSDVYFLQNRKKKGLVNWVWHRTLSVFKHHWVIGAKFSLEMRFWEVLTLLFD